LSAETTRTVALIGHSTAGKTSLAEAMLHAMDAVDRLGSIGFFIFSLTPTIENCKKQWPFSHHGATSASTLTRGASCQSPSKS